MKYCSKCDTHKPFTEYSKNRSQPSGYNNYCKSCFYSKDQIRRQQIRTWFREYKNTLKCEQCGEDHPATFDFHHKDPSTKSNNVQYLAKGGYSINVIKAEIEKCSVLCANCHRKLHWNERNDEDIL